MPDITGAPGATAGGSDARRRAWNADSPIRDSRRRGSRRRDRVWVGADTRRVPRVTSVAPGHHVVGAAFEPGRREAVESPRRAGCPDSLHPQRCSTVWRAASSPIDAPRNCRRPAIFGEATVGQGPRFTPLSTAAGPSSTRPRMACHSMLVPPGCGHPNATADARNGPSVRTVHFWWSGSRLRRGTGATRTQGNFGRTNQLACRPGGRPDATAHPAAPHSWTFRRRDSLPATSARRTSRDRPPPLSPRSASRQEIRAARLARGAVRPVRRDPGDDSVAPTPAGPAWREPHRLGKSAVSPGAGCRARVAAPAR